MNIRYILSGGIIMILFTYNVFAERAWVLKNCVKYDEVTEFHIDKQNNIYAFIYGLPYTKIYKSTDTGETWNTIYKFNNKKPLDTLFRVAHCDVVDARNVYMSYLDGISLEISSDSGKTFVRKGFKVRTRKDGNGILEFKMYNNRIGAIATYDELIITYDNWDGYKIIPNKYKLSGRPFYFLDSTHIVISKTFGKTDELVLCDLVTGTWSEYYNGTPIDSTGFPKGIKDIVFVDDSTAFACGGQRYEGGGEASTDIIWKTTDKGRHWDIVFDSFVEATWVTLRMSFEGKAHGVALGSWGKIIETLDSGKTWHYITPNKDIENTIAGATIIVNDYVFISADDCIFRYEDVSSSIEEAPEAFSVFPVPAPSGGALHIALGTQISGTADISIYDLRGTRISTLFTGELSSQDITVSLPALPSGPYFIAVTTPAGVYRRKVVVQ